MLKKQYLASSFWLHRASIIERYFAKTHSRYTVSFANSFLACPLCSRKKEIKGGQRDSLIEPLWATSFLFRLFYSSGTRTLNIGYRKFSDRFSTSKRDVKPYFSAGTRTTRIDSLDHRFPYDRRTNERNRMEWQRSKAIRRFSEDAFDGSIIGWGQTRLNIRRL